MTNLYKIQENLTVGWTDIEEQNCTKLTRDQCKDRIAELIREGYNPNYLRVQPDNND